MSVRPPFPLTPPNRGMALTETEGLSCLRRELPQPQAPCLKQADGQKEENIHAN